MLKQTILSLVGPKILHDGHITDIIEVSENFRFIGIEAESFRHKKFQLGEKVQINIGDWQLRTYTPFSINSEPTFGVLAYMHGNGPGSRWAHEVEAGDLCQFLGPRPSLKLAEPSKPLIVFGDETTIGLSCSLKRNLRQPVQFVFEASDTIEVESITRDVGLTDASVFAKSQDGEVPLKTLRAVGDLALTQSQIILAGRAQSIEQMKSYLWARGVDMSQVTSKIYWSQGRHGLD